MRSHKLEYPGVPPICRDASPWNGAPQHCIWECIPMYRGFTACANPFPGIGYPSPRGCISLGIIRSKTCRTSVRLFRLVCSSGCARITNRGFLCGCSLHPATTLTNRVCLLVVRSYSTVVNEFQLCVRSSTHQHMWSMFVCSVEWEFESACRAQVCSLMASSAQCQCSLLLKTITSSCFCAPYTLCVPAEHCVSARTFSKISRVVVTIVWPRGINPSPHRSRCRGQHTQKSPTPHHPTCSAREYVHVYIYIYIYIKYI
jgi:hypothetical protein